MWGDQTVCIIHGLWNHFSLFNFQLLISIDEKYSPHVGAICKEMLHDKIITQAGIYYYMQALSKASGVKVLVVILQALYNFWQVVRSLHEVLLKRVLEY